MTLPIEYFRPFLLNENWSSGGGLYPEGRCARNVLFDVLDACVGHGYPAEGDELADTTAFLCNTILAVAKKPVCALVDRFAVLLAQTLSVLSEEPSPEARSALSFWQLSPSLSRKVILKRFLTRR